MYIPVETIIKILYLPLLLLCFILLATEYRIGRLTQKYTALLPVAMLVVAEVILFRYQLILLEQAVYGREALVTQGLVFYAAVMLLNTVKMNADLRHIRTLRSVRLRRRRARTLTDKCSEEELYGIAS